MLETLHGLAQPEQELLECPACSTLKEDMPCPCREVTAYGGGEGGCYQPIRERAGERGFLSSRVRTTPNDDAFYHVDFYND